MSWSRKQRIAEAIVQGQVIAQEMAKTLKAPLPPPVAKPAFPKIWTFGDLGLQVEQRTTVASGEKDKAIFLVKLTPTYVGIVRRVASNYYRGDDVYWKVDRKTQEGGVIHRAIGVAPNTLVATWRVFYDEVRWLATNKGTTSHKYVVLNDGYIGLRSEEQAFLDTVRAIG